MASRRNIWRLRNKMCRPDGRHVFLKGKVQMITYLLLDGRRSPSRDKVISLCLALKLELPETQRALTLTKNGQLYSKSKRDSILIFALGKKLSVIDTNVLLEEMNEPVLN